MNRSVKHYLLTSILFVLLLSAYSEGVSQTVSQPPFLKYMNSEWVNSTIKTLTLEEQIAQTMWVAAYSNRDSKHEEELKNLIEQYGIGGMVFFQGTAEKQIEMINSFQSLSKVPLMMAIDAEWGVGMRLTGVGDLPYQMTLGAITNDSIVYRMAALIAEQCKSIGVQFNFAPVADVNNNADNPVIGYRSFGEDRENVARKTAMYMKGLQDNNIAATAKHFPGHGDTDVDSHSDLPIISHPRARLDSIELYPFRQLINEGLGGIMIAHLNLPSLDTTTQLPSTLSKIIVTDILKKELGFEGIVVTDAMNMSGVTKYFQQGEAEAMALAAGNDVAEFVLNVGAAITAVKKKIDSGELSVEDIENKCRKILALKYWTGVNNYKPLKTEGVTLQLNSNKTKNLIREIYANALTVLNNQDEIIPIKNGSSTAVVTINGSDKSGFIARLRNYQNIDSYNIDLSSAGSTNNILSKLQQYETVVVGVFGLNQRPATNYGATEELNNLLTKIVEQNKTIVTWFGNPYGIANVAYPIEQAEGVIVTYQDNTYTHDLAAQLIFGGIEGKGKLPITINEHYRCGYGLSTKGNIRVQYGYPETVGLNSATLYRKIDSLATLGITRKAYPGCQVMIAKDGVVILQKNYGHLDYEQGGAVSDSAIYDIASLTKITATLPSLMILDGEGLFSTKEKMGNYFPFFQNSNKADLQMSDILAHQARLLAWIPFYSAEIDSSGELNNRVFRTEFSERYSSPVAENLYIKNNYRKEIFRQIRDTTLNSRKQYLYSDLGFIIYPTIIENITGDNFTDYVQENLFDKLGADILRYNPFRNYDMSQIAPTEYDTIFRHQLVRGYVHDQAAAMLGGVSGHAGLFSNANDMMKVMEMYRSMGAYGGEQIIDSAIVAQYTKVQFPENKNRRALGFDKPSLDNSKLSARDAYPCKGVSMESYGHTGFTGTMVWVDPVENISYVFLSNRVYPSSENTLISKLNIRTEILQAVYDCDTLLY